MTKFCAAAVVACALMAGPASAAPTEVASAEARARAAVAPPVVESALCIRQTRRRVVCLLAHPDVGGLECRSAVVVRRHRVRVVQSNVCFEFRGEQP